MPDFKPEDIYKIMLVGDSEVGKSQLARCYHHKDTKLGPHAPSQAIYYQTGVEKVRSSSNSSAGGVKKQLWVFDTAGKTKHQNLVSSFYPGIHGFLLVFDLMEEASFVSVREKWAKLVRAKSNDHAKFFLIGNKLDCDEYREVDYQRAKDFAETEGMTYREVSATNVQEVHSLFHEMAQTIKDFFDQFPRGLLEDIPPTPKLPHWIKPDAAQLQSQKSSVCSLV